MTRELEESQELFKSVRESVINNDIELLEHIETQEQVDSTVISLIDFV